MNTRVRDHGILIVDFGSQYTQLIARRVRELGIFCEIHPFDITNKQLVTLSPKGVILSGGPDTVTFDSAPRISDSILTLNVPILGICYGMQAMAEQLGGTVDRSEQREFGAARVLNVCEGGLLDGLTSVLEVWMSHGDRVETLPPGFKLSAETSNAPIAAMSDLERKYFGVQFHPEVTHTSDGKEVLRKFVIDICECAATWTAENIIEESVVSIRERVGQDRVILGLSGGVDSSVVAALISRAIGDQLTCIFVDNGLLRKNEREEVENSFASSDTPSLNLVTVDEAELFLKQLQGRTDPEEKRKIIGNTFIDVFERESKKIEGVKWLAQGTIYPDVIESAASKFGKAQVIKSHHNVGGLPDRMELGLVEPLRELFKDEVREIGIKLGLPRSLLFRHPFPGPGLSVRVMGEVKSEYLTVLREADAIFIEELRANGLYDQVSQAFAVYLPVKSVGVVGDSRRYEHVIALRAVETTDFMTAGWANLPHDFIGEVSNRIINELSGVSRVVYDVSSKPPATIEWE